ncbi:MAG: serpin family protein, partial [Actinomycetota bacterium]
SNHIVASMVRFNGGKPDNQNYRRYRIKTVKGQNDFASMAEVVRRRYWRILLQGRDLLGAEAAAATAVVMDVPSAPIGEEPVTLTVDRSFTFWLREVTSGTIVFMGRVNDPSATRS